MTQGKTPPLGWEHLVTDGHVRAAQIRRAQPRMIAVALILMLIGLFFLSVVKPPTVRNDRAQALNAQVDRERRHVLEVFSGLPPPRIARGAMKDLLAGNAVVAAYNDMLVELNRTGELPSALLIDKVSPSAFWRSPWPQKRYVSTGTDRVKLVGVLVNIGSADYPQAARVLAVYRRKGDDWSVVTVQGPDFQALPDKPQIPIETIPLTLKPVLKTKE